MENQMTTDEPFFSPESVIPVPSGLFPGHDGGIPEIPGIVTWTDDGNLIVFRDREMMKEITHVDRSVLAYLGLTVDDIATGIVIDLIVMTTKRYRGDILNPLPW